MTTSFLRLSHWCAGIVTLLSAKMGRDGSEHAFGIMRVWGTVGFFAMVVGFPWLLHIWQDARGLAASPGRPSETGLERMFPIFLQHMSLHP